ncbi:hypothetical protein PR048_001805 [Dryococelus australis]|uniref:Uncharacterized protein n=1 Tax=Dryococelus australis TaxID=614101 RepID=A0ABQ9IIH4_9NEOP|nr:hypothetical protein PR048_001805 [Dryococelus australis]
MEIGCQTHKDQCQGHNGKQNKMTNVMLSKKADDNTHHIPLPFASDIQFPSSPPDWIDPTIIVLVVVGLLSTLTHVVHICVHIFHVMMEKVEVMTGHIECAENRLEHATTFADKDLEVPRLQDFLTFLEGVQIWRSSGWRARPFYYKSKQTNATSSRKVQGRLCKKTSTYLVTPSSVCCMCVDKQLNYQYKSESRGGRGGERGEERGEGRGKWKGGRGGERGEERGEGRGKWKGGRGGERSEVSGEGGGEGRGVR